MPKASGQTLNKSGPHPVSGPDRASGPAGQRRVAPSNVAPVRWRALQQTPRSAFLPVLRPVSPARFPVRLHGLAARFDYPVWLPGLTEQSNFAAIVPRHTTRTPAANGPIRPSGGPKQPSVRAGLSPLPRPYESGARPGTCPIRLFGPIARLSRRIWQPDAGGRRGLPVPSRSAVGSGQWRTCPGLAPTLPQTGSGRAPDCLQSCSDLSRSGSGLAPSMTPGHSRLVPVERNLPRLAPTGPNWPRFRPSLSDLVRHDPLALQDRCPHGPGFGQALAFDRVFRHGL